MECILFGILGLVLGAIAVFFILRSSGNGAPKTDSLMIIQNQIDNLTRALESKLGESGKEMREAVRTQFSESQRLIRDITKDITEQITEVKESNKQVFTIAEQLENLEKVLKHQKQRGNLGEASLELILSNILPPTSYKMQYEFKNREVVDAVILTQEGFIPVDAKYSLDNYRRIVDEKDETRREVLEKEFSSDLKKRIDETSKYIRPEEGTLPFAFMFIPAEAIYYDLLVNEVGAVKVNTRSLLDYAYNEKKVIIVSPTTFAAYLQSVLYGFKAFKIESKAQEIRKNVGELVKHLSAYESYFGKVGAALSTTVNQYNLASKELKKVDKDMMKIDGSGMEYEPTLLDKPQTDE